MSIELTNDELDRYLNIIFTGSKFVEIDGVFVVLKQPDNLINMRAQLVYDTALNQAVKDGLLTKNKLEDLIEKRGLFTEADKDKRYY